jgi:hypothetical protein
MQSCIAAGPPAKRDAKRSGAVLATMGTPMHTEVDHIMAIHAIRIRLRLVVSLVFAVIELLHLNLPGTARHEP